MTNKLLSQEAEAKIVAALENCESEMRDLDYMHISRQQTREAVALLRSPPDAQPCPFCSANFPKAADTKEVK